MNAQPILEALNKGVVHIWFTSLNSGNELDGHFTLKDRNVGKIDPTSAKIPAFDISNNKWEDIEVSTINQWASVPNNP
jgi:hypothetical protein|tara:strand:- start:104 stop:337 length:234 start_codon:yes stop_codon:yes gene_type:complete